MPSKSKRPPTTGQRFRLAREASGLTQSEVARRLGCPPSRISAVESDTQTPSPQWLLWSAAVLKWDAKALDPQLEELVKNLIGS